MDGVLIAFVEDKKPDFPLLCRRMLHGERRISVMFVVFDLLADHGRSRMAVDLGPEVRRRWF